MNFKNDVLKIIRKYNTNNPISILTSLGVYIQCLNVDSKLGGVYMYELEYPSIYINSNLSDEDQKLVSAYILAQYTLYKTESIAFTFVDGCLPIHIYDDAINSFVTDLLLDDTVFTNYRGYPYSYIAKCECIPEESVKLKYSNISERI